MGLFVFIFPRWNTTDRRQTTKTNETDGRTFQSLTNCSFSLAKILCCLCSWLTWMFKLLALCNRPRSRSDITGFVCNFVDNGKMNSQSTHNISNRIQSNPKKQIKTNQGRHALAVFLSYCLGVLLFDSVGSNTRNPDGKSRQKRKGANQNYHNSQSDGLSM